MLRVIELRNADQASVLFTASEHIPYEQDISISLHYMLMNNEIIEHYVNHTGPELKKHIDYLFSIIDEGLIWLSIHNGIVINFDKVDK